MNQPRKRRNLSSLFGLLAMMLGVIAPLAPTGRVYADHTPDPASVTIPGSFQQKLGCPDDWQLNCATTHLTYDANDDVWQEEGLQCRHAAIDRRRFQPIGTLLVNESVNIVHRHITPLFLAPRHELTNITEIIYRRAPFWKASLQV